MTFARHHPNYYKKLKQNSGRSSNGSSEDNVSEVGHTPPTMETEVGQVGILHPTHTNHKEDK